MTEYRCEQYSSVIFGTTKHYHTLRMDFLKSVASARQEQLQEEARTRPVEPARAGGRTKRGGGKGRGRGKKRRSKSSKSAGGGRGARGRGRTVSSGASGSSSSARVGSMGMPNRFGAGAPGLFTFK